MTLRTPRRLQRKSTCNLMTRHRPQVNHSTFSEGVPPVPSPHHQSKQTLPLAPKGEPNMPESLGTPSSSQTFQLDFSSGDTPILTSSSHSTRTLSSPLLHTSESSPQSSELSSSMAPAPRLHKEDDYVGPHHDTLTPPPVSRPRSFNNRRPNHNYDSMRATAAHSEGVVALQDAELSHLFDFVKEIGYGNWGSVWKCKPRPERHRHSHERLGLASAAGGGSGAPGIVAIKLVHRREDEHTPHQIIVQRVRALWGEMKIIHGLRREPHPNIIRFEAFVITPNYALIIMPYLAEQLDVPLSAERARPYFRQLASAVAYLHERGVCHNDIKPANLQIGYPDVPVLIDFGFAVKHSPGERGRFLSTASWGTPEYLDPQRAAGEPHDERKADVWSLGVTFYEILIGRTPFERDEDEIFESKEDLERYHDRARTGKWLGDWSMPKDLEHLLRWMIYPNPTSRATALQAYHHPSLESAFDTDQMTPSIVRHAVNDQYEDAEYSFRADEERYSHCDDRHHREPRLKAVKSDIGQRKERRPQALGESVRQTTSATHLRPNKKTFVDRLIECDQENSFDSLDSSVLPDRDSFVTKRRPRMPTPSHAGRVGDVSGKQPRVSEAQTSSLRPASANAVHQKSLRRSSTTVTRVASLQPGMLKHTDSGSGHQPSASPNSSPAAPRTRQEALLKTMRSLEGERRGLKESTPPAKMSPRRGIKESTSPAKLNVRRPVSLDLAQALERQASLRRSALLENVAEVEEVLLSPHRNPQTPIGQKTAPRSTRKDGPPSIDLNISTNTVFSRSIAERSFSGKNSERSIESLNRTELELISRYRAGELPARAYALAEAAAPSPTPTRRAKQSTAPCAISTTQPPNALEDLDRLAEWAKSVERYVKDSRRAIAEHREPPSMPPAPEIMRGLASFSRPMTPMNGLAPPSHSASSLSGTNRTSSTIVDWPQPTLTKRHTVSQVFKRFVSHTEKTKERMVSSPEPRDRLSQHQSESSLGSRFNTNSIKVRPLSPITHEFEEVLSDYGSVRVPTPTPNLVSQRMAKPTSMVSLRDKARALLPGEKNATLPRHIRPQSGIRLRPDTPGAASVMTAKPERGERKSIFQLFGLRRKAGAL